MMRYFLLFVVFLLIIGRFRRPLLSAWRSVLPLVIGGIIGLYVVNSGRFQGAPGWLFWLGPVFGAFLIGGAIKELFNDFMPPKRRK